MGGGIGGGVGPTKKFGKWETGLTNRWEMGDWSPKPLTPSVEYRTSFNKGLPQIIVECVALS